ncbi:hypothetical protein LHJ74_03960 [Streptomyces sp. N2-109]|uniref:Uncharacterized protein n=1 Tax=Streptomyces gossypii TaxID=2883101 RepID=A0ABT2JN06_9ACTN|nr:hypothetical protein [Streptomyces gossypii]MCT2589098.1 hypothetical protein [Streptomyces gossypii]
MKLLGRVESMLVEEFFGTEVFYALAEPISLYRPKPKPPYIGEAELVEAFTKARALFEK